MMYYVYALASARLERVYVCMTKDVDARFKEHNSGKTKSTKGYGPWAHFYTEEFETSKNARCREKYLKSGSGKELLKHKLKKICARSSAG